MLSKLQQLSLVSKVCAELDAHLGLSDKTLAEFIIHLGQTSADPSEFGTKLAATGTEFPPGFVQSLFATIKTMSVAIEAARAPKTRRSASSRSAAAGGDVVYKAMAIPDMAGPVPLRGMAHESDPATRSAAASGGGSSSSSAAVPVDSTVRPGKRGREGDAVEADRVVRARGSQSSAYGALGIPPPDPPRAPLTKPELYGIYDGTISKLMDFGAFVELEGFARGERIEGLVHVSRLANHGMVKKAEDVVSRGQKVKVKVLMMGTGKLTLSMRDVDQKTGKDLMPRAADGSLAVPDRGPRRKGKSSLGLSDEKIAHLKTLGKGRAKLQVGDYERWEIAQLRKTGLLNPEDDPGWDAERGYALRTPTSYRYFHFHFHFHFVRILLTLPPP